MTSHAGIVSPDTTAYKIRPLAMQRSMHWLVARRQTRRAVSRSKALLSGGSVVYVAVKQEQHIIASRSSEVRLCTGIR